MSVRVTIIMEHDLGEPHMGERCGHTMPHTAHKVSTGVSWSHVVRRHGATYCVAPLLLCPSSLTILWSLVIVYLATLLTIAYRSFVSMVVLSDLGDSLVLFGLGDQLPIEWLDQVRFSRSADSR